MVPFVNGHFVLFNFASFVQFDLGIYLRERMVFYKNGPFFWGESPGLVVMGRDLRSKGHGFKSRRRILDGDDIFSH